MKICPKCYLENTDVNIFCERCGANLLTGEVPLSDVSPVPPTPNMQYMPYLQPIKKSKTKFIIIGVVSSVFLLL